MVGRPRPPSWLEEVTSLGATHLGTGSGLQKQWPSTTVFAGDFRSRNLTPTTKTGSGPFLEEFLVGPALVDTQAAALWSQPGTPNPQR